MKRLDERYTRLQHVEIPECDFVKAVAIKTFGQKELRHENN